MRQNTVFLIRLISLLAIYLASCNSGLEPSSKVSKEGEKRENNALALMQTDDLGDFRWLNEPQVFALKSEALHVTAEKETDYFNNPEDNQKTASAHLLYQEVAGDFVVTARVRPDFSSLWNAVALMVHMDNDHWIKFAFENSDATGKTIVSVVTKGVSDDANGAIQKDQDHIWLKLIRKNHNYSMLWSADGKAYNMARLTRMPAADSVKIGLEFQSPVGESAAHEVDFFRLEKRTVEDMRKGE